MKTRPFLLRVIICFLISLIPLGEFDNRIYSWRLKTRLPNRTIAPSNLLIVELPREETQVWNAPLIEKLTRKLHIGQAKEVIITWEVPEKLRQKTITPLKLYWSDLDKSFADTDGIVRRFHSNTLDYNPLINFIGKPGTIERCSLSEVLSPSPRTSSHCSAFRDKTVLLTYELLERGPTNSYVTPLGKMSQAEVLANQIYTTKSSRTIYEASVFERALLSLALIVGTALLILYYPVLLSAFAVSLSGIFIIVFLFQLLFIFLDLYIPSANLAASMLVSYLTFTGYRLAVQENLQWRTHKQQQYLKELDQMKTNFLSLVSHDLKTPIAKIQAVVDRLRRDSTISNENRELLDSIENSNTELQHYITSILNLSRIESQKVILNIKSNDINRIIQAAHKRLRPLAQNKDVQIEEQLEPLFGVECDEDLVRQVVSNLLDNAIKHSPSGQKVIIRSKEEEGFIRVEVEDFGAGIPQEQLPLMFRKFSRLMNPAREQVKGSGLGLYLSKYFIERHGGSIRARSVLGKGSVFSFTLPLHGAEAETILG